MAKITAKEVTNGMKFTLEKDEEYGFCWEKGKDFLSTMHNPPLKSEIMITKATYKDGGTQLLDFSIKGDPKEYTTHWITFKNNTMYQSGVTAPKTGVIVTSTGPFAGFDLALKSTEIQNFATSGFMIYSIELEFVGTFTGAKKLSTKLINTIKTSPGFAAECKHILTEHLKARETKIKEYIAKTDRTKLRKSWKRQMGAPVHVWYKAGKIVFEMSLTEDFNTVLEHIEKQVDYFVRAKTTNVPFYKTE